jgi:hypothetical protein
MRFSSRAFCPRSGIRSCRDFSLVHDEHTLLPARTVGEDQIVRRRENPLIARIQKERKVFEVIVAIVSKYVETGQSISIFGVADIFGQGPRHPQDRVVIKARIAVVCVNQVAEAVQVNLGRPSFAIAGIVWASRLRLIYEGAFECLHLLVMDPYDVALTKLKLDSDKDFQDVLQLAEKIRLTLISLRGAIVRSFETTQPED